ncbi:MAG: LysR family transcriptional regulator [Proteobacteria bacterium]|nr:LysR family transcriptional regulator [Pseudomonadota bacterium]
MRFLESLLKVVELGSIAAAARAQGITATAVSQRIRALEEDLGCVLLSRAGHNARPTPECQLLQPRAERLVREAALLRSDLEQSELRGTLRLGAIATALTDHIPAIARRFRRDAPQAVLAVVPGASQELYQQVELGQLDAAILVAPPFAVPKRLGALSLDEQPLVLVTGAGAQGASLAAAAANQPLILYDRRSWGGRLAWQYLNEAGCPFEVFCEIDAPETIARMVEQGLGAAVLPRWKGLSDMPGLTLTPLPEAKRYMRHLLLVAHRPLTGGGLLALVAEELRARA